VSRRWSSRREAPPVALAVAAMRGPKPLTIVNDVRQSIPAHRGDAVPAVPLDLEQRLVAEGEEALEVARVVGVGRDAEAGGDADRPSGRGEVLRRPDASLYLPRLLDCGSARNTGQDDDELVARIRHRPRRTGET